MLDTRERIKSAAADDAENGLGHENPLIKIKFSALANLHGLERTV
jgi:hypothetical protein